MKPLTSPRPHRRDRPAGPRTEWLRRVLLSPDSRRDGGQGLAPRRRAIQRLHDRRRARTVSWELVVGLALLVALAFFV